MLAATATPTTRPGPLSCRSCRIFPRAALRDAIAAVNASPDAIRSRPFCRHGNGDRFCISACGVTGYGTTWTEAARNWRRGAESILTGEFHDPAAGTSGTTGDPRP